MTVREGSWEIYSFEGVEVEGWFLDDYDDFAAGFPASHVEPTHWMHKPKHPFLETQ